MSVTEQLPQSNGELVARKSNHIDAAKLVSIESFQSKLNTSPFGEEIKVNQFAGNSKYLPISYVEMKLDEFFFAQWHTVNFKYQVVANEIIGSLELVCIHPVTQREIRRTGAASVVIQMKKGSNVSDVNSKIKNTLVKDFPHLKSSCLCNAARSLGKAFGRDLNRDMEDTYNPIFTPIVKKQQKTLSENIIGCDTLQDLNDIFKVSKNEILLDTRLCEDYNTKKKQLQKKVSKKSA